MNKNTSTLGTTVAEQFSTIVKLKEEKKAETADLYVHIRNIETVFNSKIHYIEEQLAKLKDKYQELALELAIEAGECPRTRWGDYDDPHEAEVKQNGLELAWNYENSYGCSSYDYYLATWDDLVKLEEQKKQEAEYTEK